MNVSNHLPEPTSVHWHGLILPNNRDGPANTTQEPIQPGEPYIYEFTAPQAGTLFYQTHKDPDRQQALGMYGAPVIDPKQPPAVLEYVMEYVVQLQEWLESEGDTYPAMLMEGGLPNCFTINGNAYPATDTVTMNVGQKSLFRFTRTNDNFVHPVHIYGGPFTIILTDGNPVLEEALSRRIQSCPSRRTLRCRLVGSGTG